MLKVAIIDGNAISRGLLNTILTHGGHEVIGDTNTNPSNLARMILLQPQVICIDIGPPDENGMVLLDTIRSELPKTLVFLVSAKMEPETVQGALQRGVQGFIVKPYNGVTVLTTIRNAIIKLAKQQKARAEG